MPGLKELEHLLTEGKINRREFLARVSALGLAAAVSPAFLSTPAKAATPKKGGHLKIGVGHGSTTDTLDPALSTDTYMQMIDRGCYNMLTELDQNNQLIGELASSWEASKDAASWTFELRKGVTFHNGKTLDANDVVASINHHRGKDSKSAAKPLVKNITDIKADGKNRVTFTLSGGSADFPFLMSDYHLPIMPAKDGKVNATSGIGSGAYIIEKFDPGVVSHLKKNPNYWKKGRGHFDSIEHLVISDVAARTNALTTGAIHIMDRCDLKTVHLLKRNKNIEVLKITGFQHFTYPMHATVAPFSDNNVRMALKHGLDREAFVKTILRGYGEVGNDHPIGKGQPYFATDLPQRKYDPDKSKFYLKKAGLSSLKVEIAAADAAFAGAVDAVSIYKENLAKSGIDLTINRVSNDGYWSNVWLKKPFCCCYWGGRPTPDWMFSTAYEGGVPWNDSMWNHEKFNKLLIEARAELDQAKRTQLYAEMQQIVRDEGAVIVPAFASYVTAHSKKIAHDAELSVDFDLDGLHAFERWWMA